MHRALHLPEIVSAVLQSEPSSPDFLFSCLRVNSLFFQEACRILWEWCGDTLIGTPAGNPRPEVSNLAQIVQSNVERAQIYANCIRKLSFGMDGEDCEGNEAQWHSELMQLRYPMLEEVAFLHAHDGGRYLNTESAMMHYMEPNLREFAMEEGNSDLSNTMLDRLCERCPSLHYLSLNTAGHSNITPGGLTRYLENPTKLQSLEILAGFEDIWSSQALQAISTYQRLEVLVLPKLEDSWVQDLMALASTSSLFPMLGYLRTELTSYAAANLLRVMPNLRHLYLTLSRDEPPNGDTQSRPDAPATLLSAAAGFPSLRCFSATFPEDSTVNGTELVLLAQSCRKLQVLSLSQPHTVGITDDLIENLAQYLQSINELTLKSHNDVALTFNSLKHLGRHCKMLKQLYLSCSASWDKDITPDTAGLFPNLWDLTLAPAKGGTDWRVRRPEGLQHIADCIVNLGPKLGSFNFEDPGELELELLELTQDKCDDRMYSVTP